MRYALMVLAGLLAVGGAHAQQSGKEAREEALQAARYEMILGKLQRQNEDLMAQVRTLQRSNEALTKNVEAAVAKAQAAADEVQKIKNNQLQNLQAGQAQLAQQVIKQSWGESQRDCTALGVKHQQLKVSVKPDGSRGVRFLCFDGKALHLGSEVYSPIE